VKRHLITTADERSWSSDQPVMFLGEWCRRLERRQVWSDLDAVVAPPFGLDAQEKRRNVARIQDLSETLLVELAQALNLEHCVQHSLRYWRIVLGHWLQRFVSTACNRYFTLWHALETGQVATTTLLLNPGYSLTTRDSLEYIWATNDDFWNHVLYARALEHLARPEVERLAVPVSGPVAYVDVRTTPPPATGVCGLLRRVATDVLPRLSRATDAVIVSSYLPLREDVLLQGALGQVPQRWGSIFPDYPQARDRASALPAWDRTAGKGFHLFVRTLLPEILPICFLEGYSTVQAAARALPWPGRPRFIFTSNNFDTDEVFKAWTAGKTESGVRYFTGQHGNHYGTHFFYGNPIWPERRAADGFLTWGWEDGRPNTMPACMFKIVSSGHGRVGNASGNLLLIETCASHRIMPWDVDAEHAAYLEQQFRFVAALPDALRGALVVRLHAGGAKLRHSEPTRWAAQYPDVRVEPGRARVQELISASRLVVHSYDSTGVLEMLAANIPCIAFWADTLDHLDDAALPYYELLLASGILHRNAESAAETVLRVWEDVEGWWRSEQVQRARATFCQRYAHSALHPGLALGRILRAKTQPWV
jgi:putative transferase (TIGR04331 family)